MSMHLFSAPILFMLCLCSQSSLAATHDGPLDGPTFKNCSFVLGSNWKNVTHCNHKKYPFPYSDCWDVPQPKLFQNVTGWDWCWNFNQHYCPDATGLPFQGKLITFNASGDDDGGGEGGGEGLGSCNFCGCYID